MSDLLAGSEWWFLERLYYEGALLEVDIAEGIISAVSKNVLIDKGLSLKGASPIEVTEKSKRIRVRFSHVLAYQITDESYCAAEQGQINQVGGRVLCQYADSAYLEYVIKNSLISDLVDDLVSHYSLNLADDIIDVITTTEPSIELV